MKTLNRLAIFVLLLFALESAGANGQTLTNLYSFSPGDNFWRSAELVQGSDGNFYGTTAGGGASNYGSVFRISLSGSFSNLYSFGSSPNDGIHPYCRLVQGSDGNFYGTTMFGGGPDNAGTVFRISPSGSYTNLYSFVGLPCLPIAGLAQGGDGGFYGTTLQGGTYGYGTIFRISPSGNYSNLYSFVGFPNDGESPVAGLVQGSDGDFYGTTEQGGTFGNGTVFRISPSGSYSNLYSFGGSSNNADYVVFPAAGVVQGTDGNFYGMTYGGGAYGNGSVFRISPSGDYTNLYSFGSSPSDGTGPQAGLVQGSDGNFYGTTTFGGTSVFPCGTLFRISPSGNYTNFYSFVSYPGNGGGNPQAELVQGIDGNFYGTTTFGGIFGYGTVFRLSVPLNPPANQISAIQLSGTDVILTIPSVAGETYQLQFSDDLFSGDWSNVDGASVTNSIGALMTLTNFGGALQPQRFYRTVITP